MTNAVTKVGGLICVLLLNTASLCAATISPAAPGEPVRRSPFLLTAQPVVERKLMHSPLAQRGLKDYFEARCVLTNTSEQVQEFHTSAMAEWLDWQTSDSRVFVPPVPVISVAVGSVALRPGEEYAYAVPLSTRRVRAGQTLHFRVGFRLTPWKPGQRRRQGGRLVPAQTVWSSVVSVKVRPEWVARSAVAAAEDGTINR